MKLEYEMNKTRIDNDKLKAKENYMIGDITDGNEVLFRANIFSNIMNRDYRN